MSVSRRFSTFLIVATAATLAACAGNGNSIRHQVPDLQGTALLASGTAGRLGTKPLSIYLYKVDDQYGGDILQVAPGRHRIYFHCIVPGGTNDAYPWATVNVEAGYRYDLFPDRQLSNQECTLKIFQRVRDPADDKIFNPKRPHIEEWFADQESMVSTKQRAQAAVRATEDNIARAQRELPAMSKRGARVCHDDTTRVMRDGGRSITILGFTEEYANDKLRISIAGVKGLDMGNMRINVAPEYKGVAMQQGAMIWDDPVNWRVCN